MIRASGQMWNAAGAQQDTKAVIPDSGELDQEGAYPEALIGQLGELGLLGAVVEVEDAMRIVDGDDRVGRDAEDAGELRLRRAELRTGGDAVSFGDGVAAGPFAGARRGAR